MPQNIQLPERIARLKDFSRNLWWSWHPNARDLFRALDYTLWRSGGHNAVKQLLDIEPEKLQVASNDPAFLELYDSVLSDFDTALTSSNTWFDTNYRNMIPGPVAYFSMEFAIHNSLPIYAGGLGVLAGDICKEASDLGIPMIAVGFMYPQGYFHQHMSADGQQQHLYRQLNFDEAPISELCAAHNNTIAVLVWLGNRPLRVAVRQVMIGRTVLYLLDTDVEGNQPKDRQLSSRLYTADREQRIEQEIVLGIGGVRVLRALGIQPSVWHANEGHTTFMMLERIREEVEAGIPFEQAIQHVSARTIFTTHTPVPAGTDIFPAQLVERYMNTYWQSLGIDGETFFNLGRWGGSGDHSFNMTILGLKTADHRNAVSQIHGQTARKMWHGLWPHVSEEMVPIPHITNGIHVPTWLAPEVERLYERYLAPDWLKRQDDASLWQRVADIPDDELWAVRRILKWKLIGAMLERAQKMWRDGHLTADQLIMMGTLLDMEILTIGFARRFATYKRPSLIFRDNERLARIINNPSKPVQIIFAGKAHPADFEAQYLISQVYNLAKDPRFKGRIAFAEDYDMHLAHYMTQGVDMWLNNPRRSLEASGTSGMKAALNGVPNLSVLDGWWREGYNGSNGWAIGDSHEISDAAFEEKADAEALYNLLEEKVIPLYYDRDRRGIPHGWLHVVKESIRSIVPDFCATRMLKDYTQKMYAPAAQPVQNSAVR